MFSNQRLVDIQTFLLVGYNGQFATLFNFPGRGILIFLLILVSWKQLSYFNYLFLN